MDDKIYSYTDHLVIQGEPDEDELEFFFTSATANYCYELNSLFNGDTIIETNWIYNVNKSVTIIVKSNRLLTENEICEVNCALTDLNKFTINEDFNNEEYIDNECYIYLHNMDIVLFI